MVGDVEGQEPPVATSYSAARPYLTHRAKAAPVPRDTIERFVAQVRCFYLLPVGAGTRLWCNAGALQKKPCCWCV